MGVGRGQRQASIHAERAAPGEHPRGARDPADSKRDKVAIWQERVATSAARMSVQWSPGSRDAAHERGKNRLRTLEARLDA